MKTKKNVWLTFVMLIIAALCITAAACSNKEKLTLKNETNGINIDCFTEQSVEVNLDGLFNEKAEGVNYVLSTEASSLTLSEISGGKFTVTTDGTTGEFAVNVSAEKGSKQLISFVLTVNVTDSKPVIELKDAQAKLSLDLNSADTVRLDLADVIKQIPAGVTFTAVCESADITVNSLGKNVFTFKSNGKTGNYAVKIAADFTGKNVFSYDMPLVITDGLAAPTVKQEKVTVELTSPLYADGSAEYVYEIQTQELFDAVGGITYEAECEDENVTVEKVAGGKFLVGGSTFGEKVITVYALKRGERAASSVVTLKVSAETPAQLINGGFENGYYGWKLNDAEKAAYGLNSSPVDIWNNPNNATGTHLNGFADEAYAEADFTSAMFKVGGSGYITWKMGGNCTENLQFRLMKYVEGGDDVEVARFNNWHYGAFAGSAFIMQSYYYTIDVTEHADSLFYFEVIDTATNTEPGGFGFICLDDIVTYYEEQPDVTAMFKGNYCVNPDA